MAANLVFSSKLLHATVVLWSTFVFHTGLSDGLYVAYCTVLELSNKLALFRGVLVRASRTRTGDDSTMLVGSSFVGDLCLPYP